MKIRSLLMAVLLLFAGAATAQKKPKASAEKDMSAYLMVYFKDVTHGLYMALSPDGYSFTDINNAQPVGM